MTTTNTVSYADLADWLLRDRQQRRSDLVGKLASAVAASPQPAAVALERATADRGSKPAAAVEAAAREYAARLRSDRRAMSSTPLLS